MMLLKKSLVLTINKTAVKLQTSFKKLYLVKLKFLKDINREVKNGYKQDTNRITLIKFNST